MKSELSKTERVDLEHCEKIIEKTQHSFIECGMAIRQIKEEKLYKGTHSNFDDYCHERWGWGRERARLLIQASEVVKSLSPKVQHLLHFEAAARAISKVEPEKREEVLRTAAASGAVTAPSIQKAAKEHKTIDLDKTGHPIPDGLMEDWQQAEEVKELLSKISDVRCEVKAFLESENILWSEVTQTTIADLNNAYTSIKRVVPFAVCTCEGHQKKKCALCKGRGFISEFTWTQCVPVEIRAIRQKAKRK